MSNFTCSGLTFTTFSLSLSNDVEFTEKQRGVVRAVIPAALLTPSGLVWGVAFASRERKKEQNPSRKEEKM
jgi:hypothetical protein